jgi:hypothetical protein
MKQPEFVPKDPTQPVDDRPTGWMPGVKAKDVRKSLRRRINQPALVEHAHRWVSFLGHDAPAPRVNTLRVGIVDLDWSYVSPTSGIVTSLRLAVNIRGEAEVRSWFTGEPAKTYGTLIPSTASYNAVAHMLRTLKELADNPPQLDPFEALYKDERPEMTLEDAFAALSDEDDTDPPTPEELVDVLHKVHNAGCNPDVVIVPGDDE